MLKEFARTTKKRGGTYKINAVVCGSDRYEILKCFGKYVSMPEVDVISFSRRGQLFFNQWHDKAREAIVKECLSKYPTNKPVHLLGANSIRDYYYDWPRQVRSIDSKLFATIVLGKWNVERRVTEEEKKLYIELIKNVKRHMK